MQIIRKLQSNDHHHQGTSNAFGGANAVPLTEERLAILGHEIRNPLSALSCALDVCQTAVDNPPLMEELFQIMRRQVSQLTRLSNDLLDDGSITQGRLSIHREVVDLVQVIGDACEEIQPQIKRCGHLLTMQLSKFPMKLWGDQSRLVQVIANLIQNSAKFTPRNGNLFVTLSRELNSAVICIGDNGRGISVVDLATIFDGNSSLKNRSPGDRGGLGIGLRLAKTIVQLHGGTIEAFSEGLGYGSTFEVRLPISPAIVAAEPLAPLRHSLKVENRAKLLPNYRIVVVDDDRSIQFLMSSLLQKLDQTVTVADNSNSTIEMILSEQPEVVFLDLQMHGVSGFELARQLRSYIKLDGLVLIALSGSADAASKKLAAESGFDRYMVKPTSLSALAEVLLEIDARSSSAVFAGGR